MAIKIALFVVIFTITSAVLATNIDHSKSSEFKTFGENDHNLVLPPTLPPEEFDKPIDQPTGDLSLGQAIILTLRSNPELATFSWAIRSREIDLIEAGLFPNPEAQFEVENFAGSDQLKGFRSAESTITLSQLIELGGKRMKRQQLASKDRDLARWDYEVKRVDLLSQVTISFIEVLGNQERLQITKETNVLAQDIYNTVKKRVDAGKVSPIEEIKARVELSKTRLEQIKAERQLTISRNNLIALWGGTEVTFTKAVGDFSKINTPPVLNAIVGKLKNNPDLIRWVSEMSRYQSVINLARAQTVPDVSVSAGIRHLNDLDDFAAVASISVPLFLFNNKQTGVRRSNVELSRAIKQREVTELKIRTALMTAHERLQILFQEATTLHKEVLPSAEEAFNTTKKIYRLGKLNLLDLLDAQRTYFEARQQNIDVIKEYHRLVVTIERLLGTSLFDDKNYITTEKMK